MMNIHEPCNNLAYDDVVTYARDYLFGLKRIWRALPVAAVGIIQGLGLRRRRVKRAGRYKQRAIQVVNAGSRATL